MERFSSANCRFLGGVSSERGSEKGTRDSKNKGVSLLNLKSGKANQKPKLRGARIGLMTGDN